MPKSRTWAYIFAGLIVAVGFWARFWRINANQFLFYDEGMYLGYNRAFLNLVAHNPPHNIQELCIILSIILKTALNTPKALWFFLLNLRVFVFGPEAWAFARWISALSGVATVVMLFFWSRRFLKSTTAAILSVLFLLILPSHVFYSRLGMQESLSTFLFLAGVYLYMARQGFSWHVFASAVLLACVYLTNYRMIIAPVFIVFIEFFGHALLGGRPRGKDRYPSGKGHTVTLPGRVTVFCILFYGLILLVGSLYGGVNNYVNFAWMFHQAQDAGEKFNLINFFSYPYDTFVLEGFFFAVFFWANLYLLKIKERFKLLPFGMVVVQMLMFSFASEKGARYLCVVLPFMAAAAAVAVEGLWQAYPKLRTWVLSGFVFAVLGMLYLSSAIAMARTDYQTAVDFAVGQDPQAAIVSTQPLVESLYVADERQVLPCPKDMYALALLYKQGARFLILDPQAYISWTADGRRFSPPLAGFLERTVRGTQPLAVFPHLNSVLLTRFVLDHNEQILDSVRFLSQAAQQGYGRIRVYDLGVVLRNLGAL